MICNLFEQNLHRVNFFKLSSKNNSGTRSDLFAKSSLIIQSFLYVGVYFESIKPSDC